MTQLFPEPKKESGRPDDSDLSDSCFSKNDSCFSKSICSSTDCTGLIPALPSTEQELEAYEEMYSFCAAPDDVKN